MNLQEIKESYINSRNEINILEKKVQQKQKQITRLENRISKQRENSWWGYVLVRGIMDLVKIKFPNIVWDDDKLIPMGMKCRISVFGKVNNKTVGITFVPTNLMEGTIAFENGFKNNSYPKDSLGDLNGFCYKDENINNIEQVYKYINSQI